MKRRRLTFDILSRKLDLFGQVLDASDVVLHEPSTDAPETLAGALGSDFESRLRRIYDRARTVPGDRGGVTAACARTWMSSEAGLKKCGLAPRV
jgi:hypothetical protein